MFVLALIFDALYELFNDALYASLFFRTNAMMLCMLHYFLEQMMYVEVLLLLLDRLLLLGVVPAAR
jgi:hypothetical protein